METPLVGIIMGSTSDLETMRAAATTLQELGVPFELKVVSAHRTPDLMFRYAAQAAGRGLRAIIAGAGGAAHLPGMVATKTHLPVIGVPVESRALKGLDSLLSIAQMPAGVPVATMAIGGAANAALFAARILALHDEALAARLAERSARIAADVEATQSVIRTIGILGGGQLGRMLTLEAKRMGYRVVTLEPFPNSPTGQIADEQIVAAYDDLRAIGELGARSDVVTYEFENIPLESVLALEADKRLVDPNAHVLEITQERVREKTFVRACGIPTADFVAVDAFEEWAAAESAIGYPGVLKTRLGGYDGKGQWVVRERADAERALREARGRGLIYERLIPFDRELSIIATRDDRGDVVTFPVSENLHDHGVLAMTIVPGRVPPSIAEEAHAFAHRIATELGIVGTFCVEFFETGAGLLVNEIAPRVHNSGHYSLDATQISQYELHVRAICGLPLVEPTLFAPAVMVNILGAGAGDRLDGIADVLRDPDLKLHLYGKAHASLRRKMGHFTVLGATIDDAIARAERAQAALHWADERMKSRA